MFGMDGQEIFTQGLGLIALAFVLLRYFYDDMAIMLRMHCSSNTFFALQMVFTGNLAGAVICVLSAARSAIFSTQRGQTHKRMVVMTIAPLSLLAGLYFANGILDICIVLTVLPVIYAEFKGQEDEYRSINLVMNLPWIAYAFYMGSYGLIIATILGFLSCLLAILRFDYPHLLPRIPILKHINIS